MSLTRSNLGFFKTLTLRMYTTERGKMPIGEEESGWVGGWVG